MQVVNSALQTELDKGQFEPVVLVDLYEFYASDAVPGVDGFDPSDAIETFAGQEITWNGIAYRRSVISRGEANRNMGEKTNSVSLTFSNIDRYVATWAQTTTIEGLLCVIRCVNPDVEDDSLVLFVGRCDKPSDIDKKTLSLNVRQDFGNINVTAPPAKFVAEDPNGRLPGDPLYEGFRFNTIAGSVPGVPTTTRGFLGLFSHKKATTLQWSSYDQTPYGKVVNEIFGSCQMEGIPLVFQDRGNFTLGMWVWGKGPVSEITNFSVRSDGRTIINAIHHFGDLGGTGSNAIEDTLQAPGIGFLSLTAYTSAAFVSDLAVVDDAPTVVALIRGRKIDIPDSSGVYNTIDWTDNPVHIARFILTDPRFCNIDPAFMEDAVNYETSLHCDEPIIDGTNSQLILIPNVETGQAGETFHRYQATGLYKPEFFLYNYFGDPIPPQIGDGPYEPYDPTNFPTSFATQQLLRKRYTCNFPITDEVKATDLQYKTVFPSFKGFMRVNKRGKYEIRSEKSADATRLRSATVVGASQIPVLDVTPWKTGPDLLTGRLLLGFGLTTSEVRDVASAVFSATGNAVTLAGGATGGGATLTASGATLSGGSTSVQASGTLTVAGTPAAGNTITGTIDGIAVSYTLASNDTTSTAAAMLSAYINATPRLKPYIKSFWTDADPDVVTIKCLHGALNLTATPFPTFLKAHGGPIADPSSAPTVAASSGGALPAGTYKVAYSNVNAIGSTALTPLASITVTLNQKIDISSLPAFPAGVTSRNFYLSEQAGSTIITLSVNRTNASNFSITAVPDPGSALPPSYNTTAEELLRIAKSFATNSQDVFPAWAPSTLVLLTDTYLPTVLNGHKYQVTTQGTTATTEPTWPTTAGGTVTSGTAVFTEIGSTVLAQAGLTRANIKKDTFKWPLGSRQSSVNQIKGNFRDRKNDFVLTPFKVNDKDHQLQVKKIYPLEVDLSAVDNEHQTILLAKGLLAKNREGDWFAAWGTGPGGLILEEGDLACVSDDSGGLVNVVVRIEDLGIPANHEVNIKQARKYSTAMFSDEAPASVVTIPTTLRYIQPVDSIVAFIDNFAIRDSDSLIPGFYVAVSRDVLILGDWRGWILWADYGDGYKEIARGDIAAVMGTATTTLDTVTDATVFDTVSDVTFTLKYGTPAPTPDPFVTVTEADLIANPYLNLFLIGNEYLQAATVVNNGSNSFTISDFYRGRFGTDTTEITHGADEDVVYLNGAEQFVEIDPARANLPFDYKVTTINQNVADADAASFTWTGGTIKNFHMTDALNTKDASGHLLTQAIGHPSPADTNPTYEALYGLSADWSDEEANTVLTLPMVTGTSRAALLAAVGFSYDPSSAEYTETSWAVRNNLTSFSVLGSGIVGTTIQAIETTFQRFDFEMTIDQSDLAALPGTFATGFGNGFGVALHQRANAEAPYTFPDAADCPMAVEWSLPTDYWDTNPPGTVRVTITSYGVELVVIEGVDPGFNPFDFSAALAGQIVDAALDSGEGRHGPRYSILLNGNEAAIYKDYKPGGGNKHLAKVSLGNSIPYPFRLTSWSNSTGFYLRNVMHSGAIYPSTILSADDQIAAYPDHLVQTTYFIRLRQVSRYPGVKGAPLDLTVP